MGAVITKLVDSICSMQEQSQSHGSFFVVALDGRSGVGKSTLAAELARELGGSVLPGDDFYAGGVEIRDEAPDRLAEICIDWRRIREALVSLRSHGEVVYHAFDWEAFDGRLEPNRTELREESILILEGVYSARRALRDLIDVAALVETTEKERVRRLIAREGTIGEWEEQWQRAEEWYFEHEATKSTFDLVVSI